MQHRTEPPKALFYVSSTTNSKGPVCLISSDAVKLTKGDNNGAGDAVRHNDSEDAHHPSVSRPKLELVGLVLQKHTQDNDFSFTIPHICRSQMQALIQAYEKPALTSWHYLPLKARFLIAINVWMKLTWMVIGHKPVWHFSSRLQSEPCTGGSCTWATPGSSAGRWHYRWRRMQWRSSQRKLHCQGETHT